MTREKVQRLYERAKEMMEQGRANMQRYARELKEMDKTDFWETAQKYHISASELKKLIRMREQENRCLLENAVKSGEKTGAERKESTEDEG